MKYIVPLFHQNTGRVGLGLPGSVFWKGPSPDRDDMQCVSRIISIFARASEKAKVQAFRAFLENEIGLEQMRKILGGESLSDRKEALLLVKANPKLKPKEFYEKLHGPLEGFGIHLSANPESYRKQIDRPYGTGIYGSDP